MSLNDKDITLGGPQGTDVYPGIMNPAPFGNGDPKATNFVKDPTSELVGAGAGANFAGGRDAERSMKHAAGVVEAKPGIIESTQIEPLDSKSDPLEPSADKEDQVATDNSKSRLSGYPGAGSISSAFETGTTMAGGAAKVAYGTVTGDQATFEQGKKDVYGQPQKDTNISDYKNDATSM